jgi:hypothetical protein
MYLEGFRKPLGCTVSTLYLILIASDWHCTLVLYSTKAHLTFLYLLMNDDHNRTSASTAGSNMYLLWFACFPFRSTSMHDSGLAYINWYILIDEPPCYNEIDIKC